MTYNTISELFFSSVLCTEEALVFGKAIKGNTHLITLLKDRLRAEIIEHERLIFRANQRNTDANHQAHCDQSFKCQLLREAIEEALTN